jgi:hypothetical protein
MDCAQHIGTAAVAYCCTCGKPLCEVCKRDVQGAIFCEPCLAARIHSGGSAGYPGGAAMGSAIRNANERGLMGAVVLIGLGVLFLLNNLGWFGFFWVRHYWPVILIVCGLWLFIRRQRDAR